VFHVEHRECLEEVDVTSRRLGRGLGSLLGSTADGQAPAAKPQEPAEAAAGQLELALDRIRPNRHQPREVFDPEGLEELRDSIRLHGVLQPIVVRPVDAGFELVSGERRWRAARMAGLSAIPAVVREVPDGEMLVLAMVENVQRRDLDPIERARGYKQLCELGLIQEEVAARVGLKRSTIANHLRLLELPEEARQAVSRGLITMGHARALLGLGTSAGLLELVQKTVRERTARGRSGFGPGPKAEEASAQRIGPLPPWQRELQDRMREHLGCKVEIRNQPGYSGKIVIDYHDRGDLDRLTEILTPRRTV
jgi:ParB family chromosome partitioning protein